MTESFVHYIAISSERIASEAYAVPVKDTDRVHVLLGEICRATWGPNSVRLWKPREFVAHDKVGHFLSKLHTDLSERGLERLCERVQVLDTRSVREIVPLQGSMRCPVRTTLIAERIEDFSPGKRPASDDEEELAVRWQKRARRACSLGTHVPPSQVSKPKEYFEFQAGEAPIFDGRYTAEQNTVALPVEIFYDGFAEFNADCHDESLEVEPKILKLTIQLMDASSRIVTCESDQCSSKDLISQLIQYSLTQTTLPNRSSADHITLHIRHTEPFGSAALVIIEEKNDLGTSGEGSIQGSFSFVQHWANRQNEKLFDASLCPCFIISISGPWIVVLGAVFTSRAIVQRLTDYIWIGHSRVIDETRAVRIARVFTALGRAVLRLDKFYKTLSPPSNLSDRFFPLARSYVDPQDPQRLIEFSYVAPLKGEGPSCVAYLAKTADNSAIAVKFVERYGVDAHNLLAADDLAPPLLYYGKIWHQHDRDGCSPRKMVVMEYVDGEPVDEKEGISDVARASVLKAVRLLHDNGFVHGDIRGPNILIADGEGDEEGRVKLLDFDWAGREGEVRYPYRLSQGLWVKGVDDGELILRRHDLGMIDKMRSSV